MKVTEINQNDITDDIIKKVLFSIPSNHDIKGDVVVVFGYHEKNLLEERIYYALKLYNQKDVSKILLTGGIGFQGNFNESQMMYDILLKNNVNDSDIIIDDKSRSTEENIINAINLLKQNNLYFNKNIVLLSNQPHFIRIKLLIDKLYNKDTNFIYTSPINDSLSYENMTNNPVLREMAVNQIKKIIRYVNEGILNNFDI